ncbi:hypothetical protein K4L44_13060 [Halosquirtibacter laminarini]|uniref:Uncharacterized protein n=1 Tax=Halosquirtibacter laminarini TaxID=3374600 RepID=A0AC61ND71_9BACT|nr:hypothetical protein K4L44_13060 [Prolixibacteraceae bacterium]
MSKRELKKHLDTLNEDQLKEMIVDLHDRFKDVKDFYKFFFNPDEDKLLEDAKTAINKEFYPARSRRPKMRPTVFKKNYKLLSTLGVSPEKLIELMLYYIDVAIQFPRSRNIRKANFHQSIYKTYEDCISYVFKEGFESIYMNKLEEIVDQTWKKDWPNKSNFDKVLDLYA